MDKQSQGIITLIRSALTGAALSLPQDFDWDQATKTLCRHQLAGLAIRGANCCGIPRTSPELRLLMSVFCKQIAGHRKQMQELQAVYDLLEEQGIDYMPVKGAVLKPLYPQGELRAMGDADILIKADRHPQLQQLLPQLGMRFQGRTDHHFEWEGNALHLELHVYLMLTRDPFWFSYFENAWDKAQPVGQSHQYKLSDEDHFIFLIAHFARHFRNGSVSAKNVCDFWLYCQAYPHMDEDYIRGELDKLHMLTFYDRLLKMMQVWFVGTPADDTDAQLTRFILQGGIMDEEKSLAALDTLRNRKTNGSQGGAKFRALLIRFFPPRSQIVHIYAFLEKYPFLLPLAWILRLIAILRKPDKVRRNLDIVKNIHGSADELADQLEAGLKIAGLEIT